MANRRFIDFPIAASVGDNDIVLIWQDGLNKQTTKATLLQGSPSSLAGLTDVDIAALTNGQILQYNSTTSKWENVDRTDINLSELGDVTIVAPANGQVLVYNSSTSKWENSSGGYVPYTGAVTTVNLGAQSILAGSFVRAGGTSAQFLKADGSVDSSTYGTGTVTSVALTMPTAFSVANSPVTTAGTLAVTATGTTSQYIRGDGSLATFPALTGFVPYTGATADVNLGTHDLLAERGTFANNGSSDTLTVNHTSGSGYGIIVTKGGNNEALYVSKTSGSGNAMTVVGGRTSLVDLALSSVTNTAGDFLTLSGGVVHKRTAAEVRTDIGAGTVTSVGLSSATSGVTIGSTPITTSGTITLAIATASGSQNGLLSSTDWTTFNGKQNALTNPVTGTGTTNYLPKFTGSTTIGNSQIFDNGTGVGIATDTPKTYATLTNSGQLISLSNIGIDTAQAYKLNSYYSSAATADRTISTGFAASIGLDNAVGAITFGVSSSSVSADNNIVSTERMRITSGGNVLIGTITDDNKKLRVNGTISSLAQDAFFLSNLTNGTDTKNWSIQNLDTSGQFRIRAGNDAQTDGQNALVISRSGTSITNVTFPNGNVGIGVTPNVWGGNYIGLQISATGSLASNGINGTVLGHNFYFDGTNDKYLTTGRASRVFQFLGGIRFDLAESGTAGNNISFTQAMSITTSGSILIGNPTSDNGAKLQVNGGATFENTVALADNQLRIRGLGDANHAIVNNATINGPLSYGYLGSGLGWTEGSSPSIALMNVREKVLIGTTSGGSSKLRIVGLPTSSSGLSSGDVWSDSGTLKIA